MTAKSSMPNACSIWLRSDWPPQSAPSNWWTPEMEVLVPPPTSSMRPLRCLSNSSAESSKAIPHGRKTHTHHIPSDSSLGSSRVSAAGIATTNLRDPKPCATEGTDSPQHSRAMLLPDNAKIRESHSPQGGGVQQRLPHALTDTRNDTPSVAHRAHGVA